MIQTGSFVRIKSERYIPVNLQHQTFVVSYMKADGRCGLRRSDASRAPECSEDTEIKGIVVIIKKEFLEEV